MEVSVKNKMRRSFPAQHFAKRSHCPSAENLLRSRRERLPGGERAAIEIHLNACDFCSAELQLLMRHQSERQERCLRESQGQLRRWAEDLLTRSATPFTIIAFGNNRHSH